MRETPFKDFYDVLGFINRGNPARQKSVNLIEEDCHARIDDPSILWSFCVTTITYSLRAFPHYKAEVFRQRYWSRNGDSSTCWAIEDIAKSARVEVRTIHRWLAEMREECERILANRRIIPELEDANNKCKS